MQAKRAQHGNNREHRQHCQPARCAAHVPESLQPSRGLYPDENQYGHGFRRSTRIRQLAGKVSGNRCFICVNPRLDSWLFRQRLQFTQQPLDLFGGVVVREANPHHPSALLHTQALGQINGVVVAVPREYAPLAE